MSDFRETYREVHIYKIFWYDRSMDARTYSTIKKAVFGDPDAALELGLTAMAGDASSRRYYRVRVDGESFVVMLLPQEIRSEEITKVEQGKENPFLEVARYLQEGGVGVPRIVEARPQERIIILEDLGDGTFERLLKQGYDKFELYRAAIREMVKMHRWAYINPQPDCICFKRSFDADLLAWEFHHFVEWGVEALLGKKLSSAQQREVDSMFSSIIKRLTTTYQGFVHRDFQSRNLLMKDGRVRVIDFQDALIGPFIYDLTALLRDSYVFFSDDETSYFIEYYHIERKKAGLPTPEIGEMEELFYLQTIQRKLKDAGRFVYIDRVKGNPKFLQNIPRSLFYAFSAMERFPEFQRAREVLEGLLEGFIGRPK